MMSVGDDEGAGAGDDAARVVVEWEKNIRARSGRVKSWCFMITTVWFLFSEK